MSRPAGPDTASPPTMGLTAIVAARVASSASTRPGTARIGPIDVIGFDGHTMTASAAAIASSTPGAGRAAAAPATATSRTSTWALSRTKYSWKSSQPSGPRMRVRTGWSDIGSTVAPTPRRRRSTR